ncbi:hypothetical protein H2201_008315 [Coniosporium apollinis]|uniref:Uncharacterized protein n=1 Tax=Coniosporium apollinis TaxID=61459 RepID=A0ABQ9NGW9_9PEZI|nr:hypothetical protein H2201_008315 [Coniosporium apollinis]
MPNPTTEPLLQLIANSVDRVIEQAHASICQDKIGVFDLAKINSFINGSSANPERMLIVKLQKQTFRDTAIGSWHPKQQERAETKNKVEADLDRACLLLCVSLLDYNLKGSYFESAVLGFLAVVGIDGQEGGVFLGPYAYSPYLSKFIKIAQMLVIQRAVLAAEEGDVEYPSDMMDELRERFMMRGTRSAFD